jgi:Na+:H+ antiporter, NhaA family
VSFLELGVAALGLGAIRAARARVGVKLAYAGPGAMAWAGGYAAGIHPTIAGVAMGFLTPVSPDAVSTSRRRADDMLHPWVAFGMLPVFALANARVSLNELALEAGTAHIALGGRFGS